MAEACSETRKEKCGTDELEYVFPFSQFHNAYEDPIFKIVQLIFLLAKAYFLAPYVSFFCGLTSYEASVSS